MNARLTGYGTSWNPDHEERQAWLDHTWDRAWWHCSYWCSSVGLLIAILRWGWIVPVVATLTIVATVMLVVLPCLRQVDTRRALRVLDKAVQSAVSAVGLAGLVAVSGAVGLLVLLVLTLTAPAVRRAIRDLHTALRLVHGLIEEARTHSPSSWPDGS